MRIVDTIVSREGGNSVWANVIFLGDGGETVSVRLPCPVPSGGVIGRARLVERAAGLLRRVSETALRSSEAPPVRAGRFGVPDGAIARHAQRPSLSSED